MALGQRDVFEEQAACQDIAYARQQLSCRYPDAAEGPYVAQLAVGTLCSGLIVSLHVTDSCQQCIIIITGWQPIA